MGYDLLVFGHVLAAVIWVGGGVLLQILVTAADRQRDATTFGALSGYAARLGLAVFVPASLSTLVLGLLAVAAGPWSLGELWLVLGLVGFAATFLLGILVFKPRTERLATLTGPDGVLGPEAMVEARQLMVLARLDYVVLVLVVFDMAVRPGGDDEVLLTLMAVVLVAGAALTVRRARRLA